MRQVLIYSGEDGYWIAECPSLPGCISQGKTKADAIENIKEAMAVYVETLEEDRLPVPQETFDAMLLSVDKMGAIWFYVAMTHSRKWLYLTTMN